MSISGYAKNRRDARALFLLLLIGGATGFVNGLLGAGGGIVLIYLMRYAQKRLAPMPKQFSLPSDSRDVFAGALAVTLPLSLFSAAKYATAGRLNLSNFAPLILPSLLGGLLGGFLLDRLKLPWIRTLFSLLVLVSGVLMIVRSV